MKLYVFLLTFLQLICKNLFYELSLGLVDGHQVVWHIASGRAFCYPTLKDMKLDEGPVVSHHDWGIDLVDSSHSDIQRAGKVICRQLGFTHMIRIYPVRVNKPMKKLQWSAHCLGYEPLLMNCVVREFNETLNCSSLVGIVCGTCHQKLVLHDAKVLVLKSPGFPIFYTDDAICKWTLESAFLTNITVNVTHLSLPPRNADGLFYPRPYNVPGFEIFFWPKRDVSLSDYLKSSEEEADFGAGDISACVLGAALLIVIGVILFFCIKSRICSNRQQQRQRSRQKGMTDKLAFRRWRNRASEFGVNLMPNVEIFRPNDNLHTAGIMSNGGLSECLDPFGNPRPRCPSRPPPTPMRPQTRDSTDARRKTPLYADADLLAEWGSIDQRGYLDLVGKKEDKSGNEYTTPVQRLNSNIPPSCGFEIAGPSPMRQSCESLPNSVFSDDGNINCCPTSHSKFEYSGQKKICCGHSCPSQLSQSLCNVEKTKRFSHEEFRASEPAVFYHNMHQPCLRRASELFVNKSPIRKPTIKVTSPVENCYGHSEISLEELNNFDRPTWK